MILSKPPGFPASARPGVLALAAAALRRALWPMVALLAPVACAETPRVLPGTKPNVPEAAAEISAVALEHGCFGCAGATVLVLHRDGRATLTTTGNARQGTADQTQSGRVSLSDFQGLARLAVEQRFFDQPETIDDPQQRDGPWRTVRVTRNGHDRQVFWRDGVAAPALAALSSAIERVQARTAFALPR